ncbi:hypothetical protein ACQP3L_32570, partial [Escherichia coli]
HRGIPLFPILRIKIFLFHMNNKLSQHPASSNSVFIFYTAKSFQASFLLACSVPWVKTSILVLILP